MVKDGSDRRRRPVAFAISSVEDRSIRHAGIVAWSSTSTVTWRTSANDSEKIAEAPCAQRKSSQPTLRRVGLLVHCHSISAWNPARAASINRLQTLSETQS